jgi:hypothetical protein
MLAVLHISKEVSMRRCGWRVAILASVFSCFISEPTSAFDDRVRGFVMELGFGYAPVVRGGEYSGQTIETDGPVVTLGFGGAWDDRNALVLHVDKVIDGEGNQMFVGPVYWRMTGYSDHHLIFNIGAGALVCSGPDIPTKGTFLHFEMDFPEVGPALCAGVAYAASRHILARARYYLGRVDHGYGGSNTHLHLTLGASIWLF